MIVAWLLGCGTPEVADAPVAASIPERLELGRAPTADEIAAWDIDVGPTGVGLPPGRGTVPEGKVLYARQCAACHGAAGEGTVGPVLVATEPKTGFSDDYKLPRTVGNYWPYATTLYDYVHRAMPQNAPGSLPPDDVYALVAYLLAENQVVAPDFVADAKTLPAVVMPTRVVFVPDDRLETPAFR